MGMNIELADLKHEMEIRRMKDSVIMVRKDKNVDDVDRGENGADADAGEADDDDDDSEDFECLILLRCIIFFCPESNFG